MDLESATSDTPNVVGVLDLCDLVLASLTSTAAPVMEAPPETPTDAEPVAGTVTAKPKKATGMVAYVHVPDCITCHACEEACPSKAIEVVDRSVIDPSVCAACSACVPVCPTDCISLQPHSGYAGLEFAVTR